MTPEQVQRAQYKGAAAAPYWAALLYGTEVVYTTAVPTAGVDAKGRLYVNPGFMAEVSAVPAERADQEKDRIVVLLHEMSHLILQHRARSVPFVPDGDRDAALEWNVCADLEINSMLYRMFPTLLTTRFLRDYLFPSNQQPALPDLLSAEEYWQLRRKQGKPVGGQPQQQQSGGGQQQSGQQNGQGQQGQQPGQQGQSGGQPQPGQGNGGCGGAAGRGLEGEWEQAAGKEADAQGKRGKSGAEIRAQAKAALDRAAEKMTGKGDVSAFLDRTVKAIFGEPQIEWHRHLRAELHRAADSTRGDTATTYRRPNMLSASIAPGFAIPAWEEYPVRLSILIDTSGSMSDREISAALTETRAVIRDLGVRVRVASAETDLCRASIVETERVSDVRMIGGGGTDMGGALVSLAGVPWSDGSGDDIVLLFTDGITGWCRDQPSAARYIIVIITATGQPDAAWPVPAWATALYIRSGDIR